MGFISWLGDKADDIGDGIKGAAKAVKKAVVTAGENVSEFGKDVADGVGNFFKGCGARIKQGFSETGELLEMSGDQFKEGAWVAGIGTGFVGVCSAIAQPINVVTGGAITGVGNACRDSTEVVVDENGNVHSSAKEGANAFQKFAAGTIGKMGEGMANAEIEIEEAIDEGDISKANKIGGKLLLKEAALTASVAATVCTFGGSGVATAATTSAKVAAMAKASGITAAAAGVNLVDSYVTAKSVFENAEDGVSDRADKLIDIYCNEGYLNKNDSKNIKAFKDIAEMYLDSEKGVSEEAFSKLIAMERNKGNIDISLDYFKDPYRNCDEIKALYVEGDEASKEYQEKVIEALAKKDCYEITPTELERELLKADCEYIYSENVKNGDMTKDQASRYAELDVALEYGDIDTIQYTKQQTLISLESTGFTNIQKEAYSDYAASVAAGDITEQEMIDMMHEDPDFAMCFDENGVFTVPEKNDNVVCNETMTITSVSETEQINQSEQISQCEPGSVGKEWVESYSGGFKNFIETMYAKLLTNPVFGMALAKSQVETMQKLGLQSSVVDLDDESLTTEQLAEQLVENANNVLENKNMEEPIVSEDYTQCVNI